MGEVLMKHLTAQPEVDELPAPFPHVIRKALTKDPKDRYQTVNEMVAEIFSVESLDQSVASFEPASLSTIVAKAAKQMYGGGGEAHPLGATTTALGVGAQCRPGALTRTPAILEDPADRFGQRPIRGPVMIMGRRGRVGRVADRIDRSALGQQVNQAVAAPGTHGAKVIVALLLAVAVSFGVSMIGGSSTHRALHAGLVFLNIASIVQGVLLGSWLSYSRLKVCGIWVPRLIIAGIATVGLAGASEVADAWSGLIGSNPQHWIGALVVCMLVGDWAGRFYAGRKGVVSLGSAFSIGLFAFVAGMAFSHGGGLKTAAIAAAASLVVQAVGNLWPLATGAPVPRTRRDQNEELPPLEPMQQRLQTPAAVAVEPPGFRTPGSRGSGSVESARTASAPTVQAQEEGTHAIAAVR
jgi:hypothetical protein